MFKVGQEVTYKGAYYWVISVMGETLEIAPTPHGAGSFYVSSPFVA